VRTSVASDAAVAVILIVRLLLAPMCLLFAGRWAPTDERDGIEVFKVVRRIMMGVAFHNIKMGFLRSNRYAGSSLMPHLNNSYVLSRRNERKIQRQKNAPHACCFAILNISNISTSIATSTSSSERVMRAAQTV
jgi:hypothetical protein